MIKVSCILLPSGFVHQGLYAEAIVGKLILQTVSKLLENIMFSQDWSFNSQDLIVNSPLQLLHISLLISYMNLVLD